jgi:ammonia channel protein AmtB
MFGALVVGIFASGYPQGEGVPLTGLLGQLVGTFICTIILGFIPGYGTSWILKKLNLLRVSRQEEIEGLDIADLGVEGYPEYRVTWSTPREPEQGGAEALPGMFENTRHGPAGLE